jgi:methionyl aminopeptidase
VIQQLPLVLAKSPPDIQHFIDTAYRALDKAIEVIRPGIRTNQISQAIENAIKKEHFSIVRDLSGHGIGKELHEDPYILNYKERHLGPILQPGMVFAIEPIITMGKAETITLPDGWTIITRDKSLATQVEHTVAVTENGAEVLTIRPK